MLKAIKNFATACYRGLSPFYRIPIQIMPSAWITEVSGSVLPNPHLAHAIITQLIAENPHVGDCVKQMDGEYVMQVVVEEQNLGRGTLWVNLFPLYTASTAISPTPHEYVVPPVDAQRVCAAGWATDGVYHYFVNVTHRGFRYEAAMKAIKDDRKYAVVYNPHDPIQSWNIPLDGIDMERLGFNKHFH